MMLEIEEDFHSFQIPKVVLFNRNHMSEEEALNVVKSGEYHPSVLVIPKRQYEALFLNHEQK